MSEVIIWHNNKCSKSNEAKLILENSNVPHRTFEYLIENINKKSIIDIMGKLNITDVNDMLRIQETLYTDLDIKSKNQEQTIQIIIENPSLIQRPIIVKNDKAVIARPMENLIKLLEENNEN